MIKIIIIEKSDIFESIIKRDNSKKKMKKIMNILKINKHLFKFNCLLLFSLFNEDLVRAQFP